MNFGRKGDTFYDPLRNFTVKDPCAFSIYVFALKIFFFSFYVSYLFITLAIMSLHYSKFLEILNNLGPISLRPCCGIPLI